MLDAWSSKTLTSDYCHIIHPESRADRQWSCHGSRLAWFKFNQTSLSISKSVSLFISFPVSPPSPFPTHTFITRFPLAWALYALLAYSLRTLISFYFFYFFVARLSPYVWHTEFQRLHIVWPFLVLWHREREREKGKGKDGCKHSWLLKGEIYSWVIKVYDWILPAIGCGEPRGTRSMNMNFMLLSIL